MVSRAIWNGSQKMAQMISAMAVMKLLFCMTSSYLIRIETWLKVGVAAATAIKAKRAMMNFIFFRFLGCFQNLILIFFLVCYRYDIPSRVFISFYTLLKSSSISRQTLNSHRCITYKQVSISLRLRPAPDFYILDFSFLKSFDY